MPLLTHPIRKPYTEPEPLVVVPTRTQNVFYDIPRDVFLFADETGCTNNGEYPTRAAAEAALNQYAAYL